MIDSAVNAARRGDESTKNHGNRHTEPTMPGVVMHMKQRPRQRLARYFKAPIRSCHLAGAQP